MDISQLINRIIIIGILFLFIISPPATSIDITNIKTENNLIQITTQICSFTGDITHTIQLTKQQVKEVQVVFDRLRNRLSTVESREETAEIFNDTVIELNRYNLLPDGMSVEYAQRLVNHAIINKKISSSVQKLPQKFQRDTEIGTIRNSYCTIVGNTSNTHFAKLSKRIALRLYYIIDYKTGNAPLVKIATALFIVFNEIGKINQLILRQSGYHLGVCIYFGNYHYSPYPNWLSPAKGWISTNGINGKQDIDGSFWGQTMTGGWQPQDDWYMNYTWRGCLGFTGLITYVGTDNAYYLGSAVHINVGTNRP